MHGFIKAGVSIGLYANVVLKATSSAQSEVRLDTTSTSEDPNKQRRDASRAALRIILLTDV